MIAVVLSVIPEFPDPRPTGEVDVGIWRVRDAQGLINIRVCGQYGLLIVENIVGGAKEAVPDDLPFWTGQRKLMITT